MIEDTLYINQIRRLKTISQSNKENIEVWVLDPHSGGVKIPKRLQPKIKERILAYAQENYGEHFIRLDIRFRSQFCYINAYKEPSIPDVFPPPEYPETKEKYIEKLRNDPIKLCRIRYFIENRWSFSYFSYSNMQYEPSVLDNGTFFGTLEEAFESSTMHLTNG